MTISEFLKTCKLDDIIRTDQYNMTWKVTELEDVDGYIVASPYEWKNAKPEFELWSGSGLEDILVIEDLKVL